MKKLLNYENNDEYTMIQKKLTIAYFFILVDHTIQAMEVRFVYPN